jgi:hypothetical protein
MLQFQRLSDGQRDWTVAEGRAESVRNEGGLRSGLLQRKNSEANSQNNKMAAVQSKSNKLPAAIVSPRRGLWLASVLTPWRLSLFQLLGPIFGLVALVSPNEFFQLGEVHLAHFKSFQHCTPARFFPHCRIIKTDISLLESNTGRQFAECSVICRIFTASRW